MLEPLAAFPVMATDSVEQAEYELSRVLADCRILRVSDRHPFHVKMNAVNLGESALVFNRYAAGATIEAPLQEDALRFVFGIKMATTFASRSRSVTAHPGLCVTIPSGWGMTIDRSGGSELLVVNASSTGLARHLEALTGRPQHKAPRFARNIVMSRGVGAALGRRLRFALDELAILGRDGMNPALRRNLDQMMLSALLALPHSESASLTDGRHHRSEPGPVARAEEYMRAHFREPIAITDLLQVAGCSRSVLFAAFQSRRGCAPMEFLAEQRLIEARERLLRAEATDTVSSIALASGFTHLGRFSRTYCLRFGELPSETLATRDRT